MNANPRDPHDTLSPEAHERLMINAHKLYKFAELMEAYEQAVDDDDDVAAMLAYGQAQDLRRAVLAEIRGAHHSV